MISARISKRFFSSSRRFLDTLAFIETNGGKITPASLSTINAAKKFGNSVTALITGSQDDSTISELAKFNELSKILTSKDPKFDHLIAEEISPLIKNIFDSNPELTHFVIPNSAAGKSILPRVGALLDAQPVSDVISIESPDTFVRPIYAGNALATVKSTDKLILASIRGSSFAPAVAADNSVPIEEFKSTVEVSEENKSTFVSENLVTSERPELGSATRVVAGGRGLKNKDGFDSLIEPLATKLGAAVGASRAAVDSGFCDNSLQVGQTGKIVAPDLYLAVGISGAIQHLAGMKDAKVIVAVNKDPDAPIFNIADIGLVADLDSAIPELTSKI